MKNIQDFSRIVNYGTYRKPNPESDTSTSKIRRIALKFMKIILKSRILSLLESEGKVMLSLNY